LIPENYQRIPFIFCVLFAAIFIIPVCVSASDPGNIPAPVWSDQTGIRDVLVQCSGDGKYVVSGSDTGVLRMYDQTGTILWTFQREGKKVRSIAISRSGDYVGAVFLNPEAPSFYADGEILFFNLTGSVLWDYTRDYTVERIAISDDGNSIYASGSPNLYSFDRNGTIIGQNESEGRTWVLEVTGDGSYAIAGGTIMERVHVANSQTPANRIYAIEKDGTIAWNYSTRHAINSIGISSDAGIIVNAAGYELSSFTRNGTLIWQQKSGPDISSVAVSSNGEYTAAGTRYSLRLFNRTGTQLWNYEYSPGISSVGMSDDGNVIIAGAADGIYVFNRAGKMLWQYETPESVLHVSIAKDGRYFAAGTSDTAYFFNRWGNATIIKPVTTPMSITNPLADNHTYTDPSPSASRPAPLPTIMPITALVICAGTSLLTRRIQ
jgi:WD40 repeat protein